MPADKLAAKEVNNMRLQNVVMQLRKACSHPYLFEWPLDSETGEPVADERLVTTSGKMMILDQLLEELFKRKHKVLIFRYGTRHTQCSCSPCLSQFKTMLDIIEDWAVEFKEYESTATLSTNINAML